MEQKSIEREFNRLSEVLRAYLKSQPDAKKKKKRSRAYIDDFELLRNYLEVKAKLGYAPREFELGKLGRYSRNNYRNHFGTYEQFLTILGERLSPTAQQPDVRTAYFPAYGLKKATLTVAAEPVPKYLKGQKEPTVLELIKEYQRLMSELRRPPKPEEIQAHAAYPLEVFKRAFCTFDRLNNLPSAADLLTIRNSQGVLVGRSRRPGRKRR